MKLVSLHDVSTGYNGKRVLNAVNLDIYQNDFIGIIGPNGGGKTTLLKLILGLLKPWNGSILYADGVNQKQGKRIGYLPQDANLDLRFPARVKDVVRTGIMNKQASNLWHFRKDNVGLVLERLGISGLASSPYGELSGGQRQKVLLARAIVDHPVLLILDEPDTFTDQKFEKELHELLQELNQDMAIIMVSHDLGTISAKVKTIACVNEGLHYHPSNVISKEMLESYDCPIEIIAHGDLPHRILGEH